VAAAEAGISLGFRLRRRSCSCSSCAPPWAAAAAVASVSGSVSPGGDGVCAKLVALAGAKSDQ
jgi:hypothetical protein